MDASSVAISFAVRRFLLVYRRPSRPKQEKEIGKETANKNDDNNFG